MNTSLTSSVSIASSSTGVLALDLVLMEDFFTLDDDEDACDLNLLVLVFKTGVTTSPGLKVTPGPFLTSSD